MRALFRALGKGLWGLEHGLCPQEEQHLTFSGLGGVVDFSDDGVSHVVRQAEARAEEMWSHFIMLQRLYDRDWCALDCRAVTLVSARAGVATGRHDECGCPIGTC
jgi:hypothetical protein